MLQIQTANSNNLLKLSKIFARYSVKANITERDITIYGDISNKLLSELYSNIKIKTVRNFESNETVSIQTSSFSLVQRGEIYLTDFGTPNGYEIGFIRPAIIIQNDFSNRSSPNTIVAPCTTKIKQAYPSNLFCDFSDDILQDNPNVFNFKKSTILLEHIRVIDKKHLVKYIGRLTPEFMKQITEKISITLSID